MMASELHQYQDIVGAAPGKSRLNRSGSGDALLLLTRRRLPHQRNLVASISTDTLLNSSGNAAFSSSPGAMASFFQNQARISSKKNQYGCDSSTSPVSERKGGGHANSSQLPRRLGGAPTTPERSPLRRSSKSPVSSSVRAHISAPTIFLQQQQQRLKGSTSGDNLSTASVNSQSSTNSVNFKGNEAMQVAQRSNGSTVKSVIARLQEIVNLHGADNGSDMEDSLSSNSDLPTAPHQEMAMLSQWASVDAYYKVVITKYQGIPTIVKIMRVYAEDPDIQVYGMIIMTHLGHKQQIHECEGVDVCIKALVRFSSNIEVQSHGYVMLKSQAMFLTQEPHDRLRPLVALLESTKNMFLTQAGRDGAVFVQRFLETYSINHAPKTLSHSM